MNKRTSLLISMSIITSACQDGANINDNVAQREIRTASASLLDRAREIPSSFQGNWAASEPACSTAAATVVIGSRTFELGDMKAQVTAVKNIDPLNVEATLDLNEANKAAVEKLSLSGTGDRLTLTTGTNTLGLVRCAASGENSTIAQKTSGVGEACSIQVDGKTYLREEDCKVDRMEKNYLSIDPKSGKGFFAYISTQDDGNGEIFWNSKEKWNKADESLGNDFVRQGNCWVNQRAKICSPL